MLNWNLTWLCNKLFRFFLTLLEDTALCLIQQNCEIPVQGGCKQSMKIYDVSSQFALSSFLSCTGSCCITVPFSLALTFMGWMVIWDTESDCFLLLRIRNCWRNQKVLPAVTASRETRVNFHRIPSQNFPQINILSKLGTKLMFCVLGKRFCLPLPFGFFVFPYHLLP